MTTQEIENPHSQSPMAFCIAHGIFPARKIVMVSVTEVTLSGSVKCPQCGRRSELIGGSYSSEADRLNVLLDRSVSPDALRALLDIVELYRRGEITVEEAAHSASLINSLFASLFSGLADQKGAIIGALIGAIGTILATKYASAPTIVNVTVAPPAISHERSYPDLPLYGPYPSIKPSPLWSAVQESRSKRQQKKKPR